MKRGAPNPLVHLELRTGDLPRACAFYMSLFGWRAETVRTAEGRYLTIRVRDEIDAGVVEHDTEHAFWLPYVEVHDVGEASERACRLGASMLLPPREGPAGWRSVLAAPAGATFALWQPKR